MKINGSRWVRWAIGLSITVIVMASTATGMYVNLKIKAHTHPDIATSLESIKKDIEIIKIAIVKLTYSNHKE